MQSNNFTPLKPGSATFIEDTAKQVQILKEDNERLVLENMQLQKHLASEQLLHSNLYKDWKKLTQTAAAREVELQRYATASKAKVPVIAFRGVLLITLLLALITGYQFFSGFTGKDTNNNIIPIASDTLIRPENQKAEPSRTEIKVINTPGGSGPGVSTPVVSANVPGATKSRAEAKVLQSTANSSVSKDTAQYKVRAKAYLYNQPDTATRRSAFIVHWDNNSLTLRPLEEKKGFVYVVFKNHLGQTSKGWLRKFDLYPVN